MEQDSIHIRTFGPVARAHDAVTDLAHAAIKIAFRAVLAKPLSHKHTNWPNENRNRAQAIRSPRDCWNNAVQFTTAAEPMEEKRRLLL